MTSQTFHPIPANPHFRFILNWLLDKNYLAKLDFADYLVRYPDIREKNINPIAHYLRYGLTEHRTVKLKKGVSEPAFAPCENSFCFKTFKVRLDNLNLSATASRLKADTQEGPDNLYLVLLSPARAILLPKSNLALFGARAANGLLWPLLPSRDLAYAHLVHYRLVNGQTLLKPSGWSEYLTAADLGLKVDDRNEPIRLDLLWADANLPGQELQEALISHILSGKFGDLSLSQFNKIIIDIILQVLPFDKWQPDRLGITAASLKDLKLLYPESRLLGELQAFSGNRLELSQDYDWLARFYGYEGGRSWGADHSIHHIWRRSFKPRKRICLLTSARNEGPYLLEFVAYYKTLGIEGIFVYSNDNEDGSERLLEALARRGEIYYVQNQQGNVGAQAKSFAHALSLNREILDYEWCLLTDMDELLWINPEKFNDLNEFLEFHEQLSSKSIFINWTYVGANGNITYTPQNLISRFPYCHHKPEKTGKTIFRPRYAYAAYCHYPHIIRPSAITRTHATGNILNPDPIHIGIEQLAKSEITDVSAATVYHYFTKSFDEFLIKCSRNAGGRVKSDGIDFSRMTADYFGGFLCHYDAKRNKTAFSNAFLSRWHQTIGNLMENREILNAHAFIQTRFRDQLIRTKILFREHLKKDHSLAERFNLFIAEYAPDYW